VTDDLNAWSRIVRDVGEERRAQVAGTLSAAAIILLLVTNFTIAHMGNFNEAPEVVSPILLPVTPVASLYEPCPKLNKGRWLTAEIAQQQGRGWAIYCQYEGDKLMTRSEVSL
jgi:hypothetical protein